MQLRLLYNVNMLVSYRQSLDMFYEKPLTKIMIETNVKLFCFITSNCDER